ncbi:hypothetical protein H5410_057897 [Solanum commersonii]|uniref:Uncharacterized protein n=1 Tax=Solanum commersonii TaxID=4109 RepID=A0A9J5WP59_SOLCO|nr:hypothetical protein H5410_057897 [Solanum commersonii]
MNQVHRSIFSYNEDKIGEDDDYPHDDVDDDLRSKEKDDDVEVVSSEEENTSSLSTSPIYLSPTIDVVVEKPPYLSKEIVEKFSKNGVDSLILSLNKKDLDRTLFLLRSYLRTRLQNNRLSKEEQKFAERMIRCIDDTKEHLVQSVLSELTHGVKSHLKQSLLSLTDDMVPKPQLDQYVSYRSKTGEEQMNIKTNDLDTLFYKSIKPLVESGQIDLVIHIWKEL